MRRGSNDVVSAPSNVTRPVRTPKSPNTVLNRVDLPAPLGPITVVMAPRRMAALTPFRIVILP